jgi:hypothetical protein
VTQFGPESYYQGSGSFVLGVGWVGENGGRAAGCTHRLQKSAPNFRDTSIHRLILGLVRLEEVFSECYLSADVYIRVR